VALLLDNATLRITFTILRTTQNCLLLPQRSVQFAISEWAHRFRAPEISRDVLHIRKTQPLGDLGHG
jgi:hypothetical protein